MQRKDAVGRFGEDVAVRYLVGLGMVVLDRNWRCEIGELDVVARDGTIVVACEVKTRSSLTFGSGLEAVTRAKALRVRRLALRWLDAHPEIARGGVAHLRVDVIAVQRPARGAAQIEHVRGAA